MRKLAALSSLALLLLACAAVGQSSGVPAMGSTWGGAVSPVTQIGTGNGNFVTTITVTLSSGAPSGGRISVWVAQNSACNNVSSGYTSVTDTGGNTYVDDLLFTTTSTRYFCQWSAHVTTALSTGNTIVLNCATSGNCGSYVFVEYLTATGSLVAGTPGTTHNAFSTTITATAGGAVSSSSTCLAWFQTIANSGQTLGAPSNSFVSVFNNTASGGSFGTLGLAYNAAVTTGTPSSAQTDSPADEWNSGMVCYAN